MENFHHSGKEEEKVLAELFALTKMMISWMILFKVQHYTFYLSFSRHFVAGKGLKHAKTNSLAKKIIYCVFIQYIKFLIMLDYTFYVYTHIKWHTLCKITKGSLLSFNIINYSHLKVLD